MFTGEVFIARAATSIVGKAAATLMTLPPDRRKRACRVLAKLYYAIASLEETTDDFLVFTESASKSSPASGLVAAVQGFAHRFEVPSNAFIDLSRELEGGLQLIDPDLARSLHVLYLGKADFLSFLSELVDIQQIDGKAHVIIYRPNVRILEADFERAYRDSVAASERGESYYWPSDAFDYFLDYEEFNVSAASDEAAKELLSMVHEHHQQLKLSRESLRLLLVKSFSIDELLFQPRRPRLP